MKGRVFLAVAAASSVALMASACGTSSPKGSSGGGGGTVKVWTISQPSFAQKVVEGLVDKFNKQYQGGGHIAITWIGGEAYKQKLAVSMAGHQPPGIFYTFGGQLLNQYVKGGDVADITQELNADPEWKQQYTAKDVFALATFDGKIYGVPATGADFELMWQNLAVLRKAGAQPSPATWSQFQDAMAKVKASGVAPIALAGKDLWPEMIWLQYLTLRYGGPQVFDKIKALAPNAWSDPAVLKAAEAVASMAKNGDFAKGYNTVTFASGQADQILASGKAAFQAQLYYDSANMRVYSPTFAASPDYSPFNFPTVEGGKGEPNQLVGQPAELFAISSHLSAAQKQEALAWLKFETTSPEYNLQFLANNGYTPITQSAAQELSSGKVPNGALLKKLYDIGTSAPSFQPYWDQDLPSAVIQPMLTHIGQLFDQTITPQQFVDQMNAVLAQQRK
jgi:raffinose/stachyose/melibiose transport system substrate-binding protein